MVDFAGVRIPNAVVVVRVVGLDPSELLSRKRIHGTDKAAASKGRANNSFGGRANGVLAARERLALSGGEIVSSLLVDDGDGGRLWRGARG